MHNVILSQPVRPCLSKTMSFNGIETFNPIHSKAAEKKVSTLLSHTLSWSTAQCKEIR